MEVDTSFAAGACWLADRDDWTASARALLRGRVARSWWLVRDSAHGRARAMVHSPAQFRIREVFITDTALPGA
jgi:hypothetical protein